MSPVFSSNAIDTYYEDHGDSKSYPLVLIHPIGGNILIWREEIPLLLKQGFRVIAYEIRGHHRTPMGPAKAYAMRDLIDDLSLLLEHLGIKKCALIGHSIGGIIASLFAARHPEVVEAIVMINSSPKKFQERDLEKHFTTRKIAIKEGMAALAEHTLNNFEARDLSKEKRYSDFFRDVFTKTTVDGFVAATLALYTIPENVAQKLQASDCKLLGIVGSEDDTFMRLLKETKAEIPKMELRVLKGSDHWVIIEKPKEGFDMLVNFLEKIEDGWQRKPA